MSFKLTFLVISLISLLVTNVTLAQEPDLNTVTCRIDSLFLVKTTGGGRIQLGGVPYQNGVAISPIQIKINNLSGEGRIDLIIGGKTNDFGGVNLTENNRYRLAIKTTTERSKESRFSELDVQAKLMERTSDGNYEVLVDSYNANDTETLASQTLNVVPVNLRLTNPKSTYALIKKDEDAFAKKADHDPFPTKNFLAEVRVDCTISK